MYNFQNKLLLSLSLTSNLLQQYSKFLLGNLNHSRPPVCSLFFDSLDSAVCPSTDGFYCLFFLSPHRNCTSCFQPPNSEIFVRDLLFDRWISQLEFHRCSCYSTILFLIFIFQTWTYFWCVYYNRWISLQNSVLR